MLRAENVSYTVGLVGPVRGFGVRLSAGVSGNRRPAGDSGNRRPAGDAGSRRPALDLGGRRSGGVPILAGVDLHLRSGALVGVVGPNGAGKTTLMRVLAGILRPTAGRVLFEGRSVHGMPDQERARAIAFMSQNPGIGFGFTVRDVVAMGRYAHGRRGWRWDSHRHVIEEAMAATDVAHLRHRLIPTLSGGERQRVFLARALAQQPRLLFLDEPTSDLDIRFQLEILDLVRRLHSEQGLTVVMAIHDLTMALRYCDQILVLDQGRVVAFGPARQVLTETVVFDVFGVEVRVESSAVGGPRVDFVGRGTA